MSFGFDFRVLETTYTIIEDFTLYFNTGGRDNRFRLERKKFKRFFHEEGWEPIDKEDEILPRCFFISEDRIDTLSISEFRTWTRKKWVVSLGLYSLSIVGSARGCESLCRSLPCSVLGGRLQIFVTRPSCRDRLESVIRVADGYVSLLGQWQRCYPSQGQSKVQRRVRQTVEKRWKHPYDVCIPRCG